MEEKQVQQPLREVPLEKYWTQEPAGQRLLEGDALRAASLLRTGSFHTLARPQDVLALGALVGNSVLSALLATVECPLAQPFDYHKSCQVLKPASIHTGPLSLNEPAAFSPVTTGLEPFPAAALTSGGA